MLFCGTANALLQSAQVPAGADDAYLITLEGNYMPAEALPFKIPLGEILVVGGEEVRIAVDAIKSGDSAIVGVLRVYRTPNFAFELCDAAYIISDDTWETLEVSLTPEKDSVIYPVFEAYADELPGTVIFGNFSISQGG